MKAIKLSNGKAVLEDDGLTIYTHLGNGNVECTYLTNVDLVLLNGLVDMEKVVERVTVEEIDDLPF